MTLTIAHKLKIQESIQLLGVVVGQQDKQYTVQCENGFNWTCGLAASCLLQPNMQDKVLISGPTVDNTYIIAIIEQHISTEAKIKLNGTLELMAEDINIIGGNNLTLQTKEELALQSNTLKASMQQGLCNINKMQYYGKSLISTVKVIRQFSKIYEAVVDRFSQISNFSLRKINKTDKIVAENLHYKIEKNTKIQSKNTNLSSKEITKVNGKQIHMG